MAEKKNQHFVPQFYLKRFSHDPNGKQIKVFHRASQKIFPNAPIKSQCSSDYFYGRDGRLENEFGVLEGSIATVLRRLDAEPDRPPAEVRADELTILGFVWIQAHRTEIAARAYADTMRRFGAALRLIRRDMPLPNIYDTPAAASVRLSEEFTTVLNDLHCRIIAAAPNLQFISSDHPAIPYNQLMEFWAHTGQTAAASKGLQFFFPISPKTLLVFYDPESYSTSSKKIIQATPHDMHALNVLQAASAQHNLYFNDDEEGCRKAAKMGARYRRTDFEKVLQVELSDRIGLITTAIDLKTRLGLSFIRVTATAKAWRQDFQRQSHKPGPTIRKAANVAFYLEQNPTPATIRPATEMLFAADGSISFSLPRRPI